jgi:DNA-binding NarL/FixJ family response regulator
MPIPEGVSTTITVGMLDDHEMLADALAAMLGSSPNISVVFKAYDCAGLRARLKETCPQVLLVDVSLPDGDGIDMVPEINEACPDTAVLILTSQSNESTLMRALDAGVAGFVAKQQALEALLANIRQAAAGEMVVPKSLLRGLLGRSHSGRRVFIKPETAPLLTPREREILAMLVEGLSGPEIAAALTIALPTVRTHIGNLMNKLGVHSRLQAATYAIKHGLVRAEPHDNLRQMT